MRARVFVRERDWGVGWEIVRCDHREDDVGYVYRISNVFCLLFVQINVCRFILFVVVVVVSLSLSRIHGVQSWFHAVDIRVPLMQSRGF